MKTLTLILASFTLGLTAAEEKSVPSCCAEKEATASAAGSIYELDAVWTDQHGNKVKLADFKGRPVLITMGYASCQFACPRLAADLMAIERELTDDEKKQLTILFVSIDPARDTPEKLAAYFTERNVDQSRWTGLQGTDDSVLELSVAIGTRYRKLDNNDFAHSNAITLISPTGEILHRQEGLGADPTETLAALRKILHTHPE